MKCSRSSLKMIRNPPFAIDQEWVDFRSFSSTSLSFSSSLFTWFHQAPRSVTTYNGKRDPPIVFPTLLMTMAGSISVVRKDLHPYEFCNDYSRDSKHSTPYIYPICNAPAQFLLLYKYHTPSASRLIAARNPLESSRNSKLYSSIRVCQADNRLFHRAHRIKTSCLGLRRDLCLNKGLWVADDSLGNPTTAHTMEAGTSSNLTPAFYSGTARFALRGHTGLSFNVSYAVKRGADRAPTSYQESDREHEAVTPSEIYFS